jgi:RecA/RadA recombinase
MERTKKSKPNLSKQMMKRVNKPVESKPKYKGNTETMISTGSTLLDLAISGGRVHGGGLPGGILVEIFGPSGSGKTVLLCEIAGGIQRKKGEIQYHDPEARLNKDFAELFDMFIKKEDYHTPNTIPEVFSKVREWEPKDPKKINGILADSLAALSTDMEMEKEDKMGGRRAKEFSQELRKTARVLAANNLLMVCSNQVRQKMDAGPYEAKYISPGGEAIGFYSSLRLRTFGKKNIMQSEKIAGKEMKRAVGVTTQIEVFKSSIWKPSRIAPITILFDYGIDDIRENLQFIKTWTKNTTYTCQGEKLGNSLAGAIQYIEEEDMETQLREEVIELWMEIEERFSSNRKKKKR